MTSWAEKELATARLPDARLNKRLIRLVEDLAAQPNASVPQASGSWAATKAAYNLWASKRVTPDAIRAAHTDQTLRRLHSLPVVLAIQDTTELDFTAHPATRDLGYLDYQKCRGLKVHSTTAASADGVPLGLLHQHVWARDPSELGKKHTRSKRATADKESQRWLTAWQATQEALPDGPTVVSVANREADIYDLFALPRRPNHKLLIRASHNRSVAHEARLLFDASQQLPVMGTYTIELVRANERPSRTATLQVRAGSVMLLPPQRRKDRGELAKLAMQVVLVEELEAPEGQEAVEWLLLTTLAVERLEDALRVVGWYRLRWLIERYHYVLKSGCGVEQLQLETAAGLERALATYSIVAWRLLWLTYEVRLRPETPCTVALSRDEWQALYCTIHRTAKPAEEVPSLQKAVRWIAQLGGFLGRKGDGEPGVKVLWPGLRRLDDIVATWTLLHTSASAQLDT